MNLFDISVLKYANDSKMELKNLKIRSFYLFHKCELLCLKDIKTKDSEQCFKKCEQDLDSYYKFKKDSKVVNNNLMFYNMPIEKIEQFSKDYKSKVTLSNEEKHQHHHNCLETEVKLKNYVKNLKEYLDNLDNKYSERKK